MVRTEEREKFTFCGVIMAGTYLVMMIAASAGGQALAPLFTMTSIVLLTQRSIRHLLVSALARINAPLILFFLVWLWLAASIFWSPQTNPKTSFAVLVYLPILAVFSWAPHGLNQADKDLIIRSGIASVLILAVLAAQEGLFHFPFYSAERGPIDDATKLMYARHTLAGAGSALAVIMWPAIAALDRQEGHARHLLLIPIILTAIVARYSHASSILLALAFGAFCYLAARAYPRASSLLAGLVIFFILVAAPYLTKFIAFIPEPVADLLPPSYHHRIEIWQNASVLIAEKPWFGWGLDASKIFTQSFDYKAVGKSSLIPMHPHNVALQLWLEIGLVGVALFGLLVLALTASFLRNFSYDRLATAGAIGAIGAFSVFACFSFGVWQAWFLSTGFAASGLVLALRDSPPKPSAQPAKPNLA